MTRRSWRGKRRMRVGRRGKRRKRKWRRREKSKGKCSGYDAADGND